MTYKSLAVAFAVIGTSALKTKADAEKAQLDHIPTDVLAQTEEPNAPLITELLMAQFFSSSKPDKKDDPASEDESKKKEKEEHAPDSEYWFYAGILAQASASDSADDAYMGYGPFGGGYAQVSK